jgi:hypothetical protein
MRLPWACTSIPATLRHLGHQQPISTAQHWNQPVRKVSVSEKKMLSDNACIAQKALWMLPVRRTTLAFVSTTCTARNFSRNLSKSSRSMDRRFVDHEERACSTSGQSECGLVSIWSVFTSDIPGALTARWTHAEDSRRGIGIDKLNAMRRSSRLCYHHLACRRADWHWCAN